MPESFDTLIVNGAVVTGTDVAPATVAIRDERIAALLDPAARPPAREVIDATGLHVLPGLIDTHVHTRHPGVAAREDFASGTAAAAAGGITTLFEMPIAKVPANSAENLCVRVAAMTPQAHIDFALYGGAGHENVDRIAEQAVAGAIAFKTFLQPPPPARLDEFLGLWCTDYTRLREVMRAVAATGRRHCFHCEYAPMYQALQGALDAAGRRTGRAHAESRPAIVEEIAVAMVLALAAETGTAIGVVHGSSGRSARLVADARGRGVDATVETCPPYLFFTDEALDRLGPLAKCNPPLRPPDEVERLWAALTAGQIDYIGTDHSPFLAEEKAAESSDIFAAPPGLCGLEVMAPLMLTAVSGGKLSLTRMVDLCATRAARIFNLPAKGRIAPGADADLTLVDLQARWAYESARALTRSRANMAIYDGLLLQGRVITTLVRGVRVFSDGAVVGPARQVCAAIQAGLKPGPTTHGECDRVGARLQPGQATMVTMTDVLKGVYNITPTPFHDDGTLDRESLRRLTRFTRDKGVDGMTILGVLGEADKLTERERDEVIAATLEEAGSSFPICVGTTHAGTDGCIAYSKRAQDLGAAALMIAPPKLARTNDAALRKHYLAVAAAVDIPIVVQDFPPAVGGITMSVELIAGLAAASPRLVHLKLEDDPSPTKVSQILAANPNVKIFGGLGGMMFLEELRHGAMGTMTGFGFPEILVDIHRRWTSGDRDGATEVFYKYVPLIRFENQPRINLALRKHIYHRRGAIASPRVRDPHTPVDPGTLEDLSDLLTRFGLS